MSANFTPNQNDYKNLTPFKCWLMNQINTWGLNNFPFVESDFDELTNYGMLMKMMKALNDVITNQNEVEQDMTNLFGAFTELQQYVDDYLSPETLQPLIDEKLDEMAESGELQEIIASYLNSKAIFGFDNVASMKLAENLVDGSYAKTLGYRTINDGGCGLYKIREITNDDVVDEMFIIALNNDNLIAELITNDINVKTLGAYGDDTNADDIYFNTFISKMNKLVVPDGVYKINNTIKLNNINVDIKGRINYYGDNYLFLIENSYQKNLNFTTLFSETGGLIKIKPSNSNETIIYCDFNINNGQGKYHNLLLDGSVASISLNKFTCNRLRSTNSECIKMIIDGGVNTWVTENEFIGIDIKAGTNKNVSAITNNTTCEIQYKLTDCDLEDGQGLYFNGHVTDAVLLNCRLLEIASHDNWITIENILPKINIIGSGILYPKKIQLINISSTLPFLYTNLEIFVHENGYYYHGGFISKQGVFRLDEVYRQPLSITSADLTNDHYYTLTPSYDTNQFNFITLTVNAWVEITIPNYLGYYELIFRSVNAVNVSFVGSNATTTIENMQGYYKLTMVSGRVLYKKLDQ